MEPSLSAEAYLRGRLTPAQARHFAEEGWLLVTDALPAADGQRLQPTSVRLGSGSGSDCAALLLP